MTSLYAVVEGQSEQAFAHQVLATHLGPKAVFLEAALVGTPGRKGGNNWATVERDVLNFLKQKRRPDGPVYVTTMFDYYGMRLEWPGRERSRSQALANRADAVETAMAERIGGLAGPNFDTTRFIPYVQMHELETLILADPGKLCDEFPDRTSDVETLASTVRGIDPEEINDDPHSAPSKRIIQYVPECQGRKASASVSVLKLIGLLTIREKCQHFNQWLERLEGLGTNHCD